MARVHRSTFAARERGRSRLPVITIGEPPRKVMRCSGPGPEHYIEKGQPYLWFAPGFRAYPRVRCLAHPPKRSELTNSLMAEVIQAQDDAGTALASLDMTQDADGIRADVQAQIEAVREAVESVAQQYRDADEAMGGHQGQMAQWADTLEGASVMDWDASSYDDFEPDANACDNHPDDPQDDCDDCTASIDDAREQWALGLVEEAQGIIDDIEKE